MIYYHIFATGRRIVRRTGAIEVYRLQDGPFRKQYM